MIFKVQISVEKSVWHFPNIRLLMSRRIKLENRTLNTHKKNIYWDFDQRLNIVVLEDYGFQKEGELGLTGFSGTFTKYDSERDVLTKRNVKTIVFLGMEEIRMARTQKRKTRKNQQVTFCFSRFLGKLNNLSKKQRKTWKKATCFSCVKKVFVPTNKSQLSKIWNSKTLFSVFQKKIGECTHHLITSKIWLVRCSKALLFGSLTAATSYLCSIQATSCSQTLRLFVIGGFEKKQIKLETLTGKFSYWRTFRWKITKIIKWALC